MSCRASRPSRALPILFGFLSDAVGARAVVLATAITALAISPLAIALGPRLANIQKSADA